MTTNIATLSRRFFTSIVITGLLSLPFTASAFSHADDSQLQHQHKHHHAMRHGKKHRHQFARMVRHLELTDEQQSEIKSLYQSAKEQRQVHQASLSAYKQQMRTVIEAEIFDEQAFLQMRASYQATFDQLAVIKAKMRHAVLSKLTVEQRAKWLEFRAKKHQRQVAE